MQHIKELQDLASKENAEAQHALGNLYYTGQGVPKNDMRAYEWFEKAANQGHASAQFVLGFLCVQGEGIKEDSVSAYVWWNIARANGHENASKSLETLSKRMKRDDIVQAQAISTEMVEKNPNLIKLDED